MKTASQWFSEVGPDCPVDAGRLEQIIEAVQCDALLHAAEIAEEYRDYDVSRDSLGIVKKIKDSIPGEQKPVDLRGNKISPPVGV